MSRTHNPESRIIKVYIAVDSEGPTGVAEYPRHLTHDEAAVRRGRELMTADANAAVAGCFEAGFIAADFTGGEGLIFGRINNAGDPATENEQFRIDAGGNIYVSGSSVHASDKRLKEDIRNVSSALDRVSQLNGVTWAWKDKDKSAERQMGVVAQDVETVAPELVSEHKGYKSINYNGLNALTIEAIKELRAQNEALKADVEELKKSLN